MQKSKLVIEQQLKKAISEALSDLIRDGFLKEQTDLLLQLKQEANTLREELSILQEEEKTLSLKCKYYEGRIETLERKRRALFSEFVRLLAKQDLKKEMI